MKVKTNLRAGSGGPSSTSSSAPSGGGGAPKMTSAQIKAADLILAQTALTAAANAGFLDTALNAAYTTAATTYYSLGLDPGQALPARCIGI